MTPYLRAFHAYHRDGPPHIPWIAALDFHLQHGTVISNSKVFAMYRPVEWNAPDWAHLSLLPFKDPFPKSCAVHVWSAAGDLSQILDLTRIETHASFQRRNSRLHRVELRHLFKRRPDE
jgi:hypothetical protein